MRSGSERLRPTLGRRSAAFLLALAVEALLALLLLLLAPVLPGGKAPPAPTVFGIEASGDTAPAQTEDEEGKARPRRAAAEAPEPAAPRPPEVEPPPEAVPEPEQPLPFIPMTRREYAASDIGRMRAAETGAASEPDAGGGEGAGDTALAEGRAPNGEPLYAAEWYVRPTRAQLATYISGRARESGWGLIACRTAPGYRVEDCQELGESPRGSGLAGSVRQAAWQFRVRPPRKGGRVLVGAWVSIRIDYVLTRE